MGKELISSAVDAVGNILDTVGNVLDSIVTTTKNTLRDIVDNPVEFFNGLGFSSAMLGGMLIAMGNKLTGGWVSRAAIASYGGATLFGLHEIASGDVEEGVKDLASTAISAAGGMASSGVTVNINSTPNTGINLSSSGAATFTPSLIPSYSLSFSTSGSAIALDQSMIFAQMTTGDNGGYTKPSDDTQESLLKDKDKNDINKKFNNGKEGEQELSRLFGGEDQVYFKTSKGGRYIDQLSDGIAHESKVGYTSLSKGIKTQILKDIELINMGQIEGSHWHFFTSGVTGKGGRSKPLIDFLTQNRIPFTRH